MASSNWIADALRRELVRAMMQRTQSMNMSGFMSAVGAAEPKVYDDVQDTLNITYVNREEAALAMDVFQPKVPEGTELPVIVIVHGGGLFMGGRGQERPFRRLLAHKGYLVFSLEYRLAPQATIFQQLDDVCAGMDRVGQMLVEYDVDFNRIFLMADSAGAYLACYVAAMHESEQLQRAIDRQPSRMVYAAVGFLSGMFYTKKMLADQIYGDKRDDKTFLQYMNPEHPEIVNNLPPAFLLTSCGDSLNNYSFKFHKALKKAGRTSKLLYLGDEELMHVFPITNPEHPKSLKATERMLEWMEEQARLRMESRRKDTGASQAQQEIQKRIAEGSFSKKKVWSNLKERITCDEALLSRVAVVDCTREYTYAQMFQEWDRYARVFSGLGICSDNHSRVALCGTITAEPLFALYALNMTGAEVSLFSYPDFLPHGMWKDMIEQEKITDLIISDIMVTPEIWEELKAVREKCGLCNVLLVHSLMGGPTVGPAELVYNECNYHSLRRRTDTVFLNDLFAQYQDTDIRYDDSKGERLAFITHTSGTTHGTRKMLPFTDKVFNDILNLSPKGIHSFLQEPDNGKPLRCLLTFDFSSIMALSGQVHALLAHGDAVVATFFGFMHPKFVRAVDYYNINILSITGFMVDKWMEQSDLDDVSFSSVKILGMSGGYISPEKMEKYRAFFKAHGFRYDITQGYAMSEAGGKPVFSKQGERADVLGEFDHPEEYRIKDENDGQFYRLEDGPRTGILYRYNETRCSNQLDDKILFEYTEIEGKEFLCTNDLVRVNEDGSVSFAGRADKYFVNNEGRKFDSGIVEVQMAGCSAISNCAVVPVFEKRIHDTVPVLYVVPAGKGQDAPELIRQAFVDVYVKQKKIPADNLPSQFMLVEEIPLNANGKLDIFRITRDRIGGEGYNLIPVMENGSLKDIQVEHVKKLNSMTAGTLPQGMENNSAYNVFDLFNAVPSEKKNDGGFLPGLLRNTKKKKKTFELPRIPESLMKKLLIYGNRVSSIPEGRKWINYDFED